MDDQQDCIAVLPFDTETGTHIHYRSDFPLDTESEDALLDLDMSRFEGHDGMYCLLVMEFTDHEFTDRVVSAGWPIYSNGKIGYSIWTSHFKDAKRQMCEVFPGGQVFGPGCQLAEIHQAGKVPYPPFDEYAWLQGDEFSIPIRTSCQLEQEFGLFGQHFIFKKLRRGPEE